MTVAAWMMINVEDESFRLRTDVARHTKTLYIIKWSSPLVGRLPLR